MKKQEGDERREVVGKLHSYPSAKKPKIKRVIMIV